MSDCRSSRIAQPRHPPAERLRRTAEARVHSAANPEFCRLYRINQVAELLRSTPTKVDKFSRLTVRAAGPLFGDLLDSAHQIVGVISTPSYARSIFLPE